MEFVKLTFKRKSWIEMKFVPAYILIVLSACGPRLEADDTLSPPPGLYVEGYTNQLSYVAGEDIQFHLAGTAPTDLQIDRVGKDRVKVYEQTGIAVTDCKVPARAASNGCNWPVAHRVSIPAQWGSGYYEVTLTVKDQGGAFTHRSSRTATSKCFFIVRADKPGEKSKILLQLSTNTYNAYTNWGGHSLYAYHDRDGVQGHRVSFDRPISSQFYNWELPFVAWCERNKIDIDYAVNSDLEFHPELLKSYRLIVSVGHDEYWSAPMRDNLESYIANGGNVAFFSGNTCCWQVRSEDKGRALTCYKQWYNIDPIFSSGKHELLSTAWSHHLIGQPENQLTGVGFLWGGYHRSHGQYMDGSGAFEVHRPDHWVFEQTTLKRGDQFGGEATIVGYECDGCEIEIKDGLPSPTGRDGTPANFVILATCPAKWHPDDALWYDRFPTGRIGAAVMGTYTRGGTVFTCGSTDWAHGLTGQTPMVEQITMNILQRLGK